MEEFLAIEIDFLAEADSLPDEYVGSFVPPLDDGIQIPCKEQKVGNMDIQIFESFISIKVGDHTEIRNSDPKSAMKSIKEILTDQIVFYFHSGGVEYYRADEFESMSEMDWDYYVWSGPFRYEYMKGNRY